MGGIKRSASLVMVVKAPDAATTPVWNIVLMNRIANSFFTSLQRPGVFFTTAATRPGLLLTLEQPLKSHGIKSFNCSRDYLLTEFLQTKNAWSSALGGGKVLRKKVDKVYETIRNGWRKGSPWRCYLQLL